MALVCGTNVCLLCPTEPTPAALRPTLASPALSNSLVIIATGPGPTAAELAPTELTTCTVRILRLDAHLAVHDGGGALFLQVLDRAERISKLWRAGRDKGPQVLEIPFGDDLQTPAAPRMSSQHSRGVSKGKAAVRERESMSSLRSTGTWMTPPSLHTPSPGNSPRSSVVIDSASPSAAASPNTSSTSLPSTALLSLKSVSGTLRGTKSRSSTDRGDVRSRPFDALFNLLPSAEHTGPKIMLKQAIMVTTLARPFLVLPPLSVTAPGLARQPSGPRPRAGSSPSNSEGRRWSSLNPANGVSTPSPSSTSTSTNSPVTPTPASSTARPASSYFPSATSIKDNKGGEKEKPRASHLLHVLPPFSHPGDHAALVRALEAFILNFSDSHGPRAAPMPVVVDALALGQIVGSTTNTVVDCVLSGALDRNAARGRALERRAWLAGAVDIDESGVFPEPSTSPKTNANGPSSYARTTPTGGKGKQRAAIPLRASTLSPESALPSPPPSPPLGTPAVLLTPPSAVELEFPTVSPARSSDDSHSQGHSGTGTGMGSRQLHAASGERRTPSSSVGSASAESASVSARLGSRSEPMLSSANAGAPKTKTKRWWWPFKSGTKDKAAQVAK